VKSRVRTRDIEEDIVCWLQNRLVDSSRGPEVPEQVLAEIAQAGYEGAPVGLPKDRTAAETRTVLGGTASGPLQATWAPHSGTRARKPRSWNWQCRWPTSTAISA